MIRMLEGLFDALERKLRAIDDIRMTPEAQLEKLEEEEVGELREEIKYAVRRMRPLHVLAEAADVVIVAAMLCRAYGFDWQDLESAVHAKMARNVRRTWAAHNGTARHVDVEPS